MQYTMWTKKKKKKERKKNLTLKVQSFSGDSDGKEFAYNVGDLGCIPGLRRAPGEGNGYALQYSCLENLMDRGT